jgi:formylglycine-generating enzyme required for sulfatase activity
MKTWTILLICFLPIFGFSQDCSGKIQAAKLSSKNGDYRKALGQLTAAASSCGEERREEIEKEILNIYDQIDKLRKDADAARTDANKKAQEANLLADKLDRSLKSELKAIGIAKITNDSLRRVLANLDKANEDKVRLILAEAKRYQQERNFDAAVDKVQTAGLLRSLPDSVLWAKRELCLALLSDFRVKMQMQVYKNATKNISLAKKLEVFPDSVKMGQNELVNALIEKAETEVLLTEYFKAVDKAHLLFELGVASERFTAIYLESAYCLASDSLQWRRSLGLLDTAAQLYNNLKVIEEINTRNNSSGNLARLQLLQIIEQLDSALYIKLQRRYFSDVLIRIPAGQLSLWEKDSRSPKSCSIPFRSFLLSSFEITYFEYDLFCKATQRSRLTDNGWGRYERPVTNVTWFDALEYCNWRSMQEGLEPAYLLDTSAKKVVFNRQANGYRLPLETEWAFAAGNGEKQTRYSWGNETPVEKAVGNVADESIMIHFPEWSVFSGYSDGYPYTAPVGKFQPNSFGLYDMTGNVWEWCWDEYKTNLCGDPKKLDDQNAMPKHIEKVLHGGSWGSLPDDCLVDSRFHSNPLTKNSSIGFRLARNGD